MKTISKFLTLILAVVMILCLNAGAVQAATITVAATSSLTATTTSDSVTLKWKKVSKATGYKVYQYVDGKWKAIKSLSKLTYTVKSLTASETYKFRVKTYRKYNGKTYWSNKYKSVTAKTKAMPKASAPTATAGTDTVTLKWSKVPGATGYRVYQYKSSKWVKIKSLTSNTYTVKSLTPGKTYKFRIKPYAKTSSGTVWGATSATRSVKTQALLLAKFSSSSATADTITLKWNKLSGATGYRVYTLKNGKWVKITSTKSGEYKVTGLKSNTTYSYKIKAYKKVDGVVTWHPMSDEYTVTTKAKESQLKPYRIAKYQEILGKDELFLKITVTDPSIGQVPVEFSTKGKNFCAKTVMEGMNVRVMHIEKTGKTYMIMDSLLMYAEVPKEELGDLNIEELVGDYGFSNVGEITVKSTKYNGRNVVCESYVDTVTGETVRCYFEADVLIACETDRNSGYTDIMLYHEISNKVDSKAFKKPSFPYADVTDILDKL